MSNATRQRARITQDGINVYLDYTDEQGQPARRHFYTLNGYLLESLVDEQDVQVCDGLAHGGYTLRATRDNILSVVRRHWAIARRHAKRDDE